MNARRAAAVAYTVALVEVALLVVSVVLGLRSGSAGGAAVGAIIALAVPCVTYPIFGAIMASRRPDNRIGWLCLLIGGVQFVSLFQVAYAAYGAVGRGHLPWAAMVGAWSSWVPQIGILGTFFLLLFPNGHLPSRRWRMLAIAAVVTIVALHFLVVFDTRTLVFFRGTHNPILVHGTVLRVLDIGYGAGVACLLAEIVASVVSLFLRYRRSGVEDRAKLRWIAYAGALFVAIFFVSALAWQDGNPHPGLLVDVLQDLVGVGLGLIPGAAMFAVLRYRLYDIDRIVSRTLSYAVISALLAGLYVVIALAPAAVVGSGRTPAPLVAAAVLAMAVSFGPLRRRVQQTIDRRFNRARSDAARTIDAFASRLRDEIDIDTLSTELTTVVSSALQPTHAALWTAPTRSSRSAAR